MTGADVTDDSAQIDEFPDDVVASIPMGLLCSPHVSDPAKLLYAALTVRFGLDPSIEFSGSILNSWTGGRSPKSVTDSLRELACSGWLEVDTPVVGQSSFRLRRGKVIRPTRSCVEDRQRERWEGQLTSTHFVTHLVIERDGPYCDYCGVAVRCGCYLHKPQQYDWREREPLFRWFQSMTGIDARLDHVIAKGRGGSDASHNRVLACGPCNSSKCDKSLSEWTARRVLKGLFLAWTPS